jgi:two-component system OmpR family response regulator
VPSQRILVVDDEPDVADVIATALQSAGFEVVTVHGGRAALEELAAHPYGLVVCDLVMPEVDGAAVYRAVQEGPEPRPAVLFLTGYHDAGSRQAFLREAGVPRMPKPFEVDVLQATARRLLSRKSGSAPS